MDLNDLNKVWEVKPLRRIRESEAKEILERVAKQVQPIMRKRKWKVRLLSEFSPANPSLLGLNIGGGAEVRLRLRRPNNELDFFPYNHILDTMLHELCHNEFGPHNADFYNLLDEIRKECEDLMANGVTGSGQGFDLQGRRLGGFSRQPPPPSLRQAALAAAENRAKRGALLPSGPRRVGGDTTIRSALSPIQAAAMAAERRLHDDLWCGCSKAMESTESSEKRDSGDPQTRSSNAESSSETGTETRTESSRDSSDLAGPLWECSSCTFLNQPLGLSCEACGTVKGGVSSVEIGTKTRTKMWSCKFCTLDNNVEIERCLACGEWRYSYGPPVSTHGPFAGT